MKYVHPNTLKVDDSTVVPSNITHSVVLLFCFSDHEVGPTQGEKLSHDQLRDEIKRFLTFDQVIFNIYSK